MGVSMKLNGIKLAAVLMFFCTVSVCADGKPSLSDRTAENTSFAQGCSAYKVGDWHSSMILLRKAVAYPANNTADTWYMLISSEMYAGEYKSALTDSDSFITSFPRSQYLPYIQYQKGRALFYLGEYEKSVLLLSDFCHQFPENKMYASALFWIAESFYAGYNYDEARALYERIVREYPSDAKAPAAQYRIETIAQRTREEKLLYLLKKTGEEYLSAKEDYEKQLKMYDSSAVTGSSRKIAELQRQNSALEEEVASLKKQVAQLTTAASFDSGVSSSDEIARLKAKAREAQDLLNKKEAEGGQ
jgi:TolA-binding protein/cell division protein FtsB